MKLINKIKWTDEAKEVPYLCGILVEKKKKFLVYGFVEKKRAIFILSFCTLFVGSEKKNDDHESMALCKNGAPILSLAFAVCFRFCTLSVC